MQIDRPQIQQAFRSPAITVVRLQRIVKVDGQCIATYLTHDRAARELCAAWRNGSGDEAGEGYDGNSDSGLEEVHVWLGGVVGSGDKVLQERRR